MIMSGSTMTNVWLGMLATVSLLEFLMIAAAGVFLYKMYKQATTAIEMVERVHIAPLRARVDAILDEVEVIAGKATHAQESVGRVFEAAAGVSSLIAGTVIAKTWPILEIVQGLRTAANTLRRERRPTDLQAHALRSRSRPRSVAAR
jgi:hypothetical protein